VSRISFMSFREMRCDQGRGTNKRNERPARPHRRGFGAPPCALVIAAVLLLGSSTVGGAEPPALNPFGQAPSQREDAVPGYVELSNGSIHAGMIYLTRDKRLQIYDKQLQRQREVPLQAVKKIECSVKREWLEKEWKFKETANDEKLYTGRSYPAREYLHTITLKDGRTITGPLSAIVYVGPLQSVDAPAGTYQPESEPEQFLLSKRNKGEMGESLKSLVYVKRIKLGQEALDERRGAGGSKHKEGGKQKVESRKRETEVPAPAASSSSRVSRPSPPFLCT
jgi:hypothetical protein